jgi:nicotinamidase-related amidase
MERQQKNALLLEDCCAATNPKNHDAAVSMIHNQGDGGCGQLKLEDLDCRARKVLLEQATP